MLHDSAEEVLEQSPTSVWSNIELHDFSGDFGVFLEWLHIFRYHFQPPNPTNTHVPSHESNMIITQHCKFDS